MSAGITVTYWRSLAFSAVVVEFNPTGNTGTKVILETARIVLQ
ncbi:hypothetical protein [Calothrix sp. NIES-3974]|nr:hypothetical protein [Calothrix sp. NIES-3974]